MSSQDSLDSDQPKADQRKSLRSPLIIQKIHLEAERPVFFGYSKNISRSGIFIATTNPGKPGDQLNLQIPLPAPLNKTLTCCCEIVWRRPIGKHLPFEPGMGLKFIDLPEDVADLLNQWASEKN